MRKVFNSSDISETVLIQDALEQQGIAVRILNEHSGRSAVPAFRPPAEIWVIDDGDYGRAREIVVNTLAILDDASEGQPWLCPECGEENPRSFDLCWNCGSLKMPG